MKILKEIERIKEKYPDWRVGQIIANAVRSFNGKTNCDPYHIEDEDLLEGLKKIC